ncbi:MAG: sulfite exporter TauE/SafE family protein [Acidobacteria bacterium]|nr:sulfite exporter TauE/SafE family protein [Acidobacteriota bacterium]
MNHLYLAPPIFFAIAFLFSMLGMGGSQLYIPILFWLGMDFKREAIPLGMLLNVANSLSATITYLRKKLIDLRVALPFAITMVIFAPLGTLINLRLSTPRVILAFAIFTGGAAILMLSGFQPKKGEMTGRERIALGIIAGSVLGFFAGLIGRGGGSFIVPLLSLSGLNPKSAVATSALVVTFSGSSSFISHLLTAATPRPLIWVLSLIAVILGSQLGSRIMAHRMKPKGVRRLFGITLLGIAILLIVKDVIH